MTDKKNKDDEGKFLKELLEKRGIEANGIYEVEEEEEGFNVLIDGYLYIKKEVE